MLPTCLARLETDSGRMATRAAWTAASQAGTGVGVGVGVGVGGVNSSGDASGAEAAGAFRRVRDSGPLDATFSCGVSSGTQI